MASESATVNETTMAACMKAGDYAGVLSGLQSAEKVTHRMINMAFTANVESGRSIESAAVEMLQSCAKHNVKQNQLVPLCAFATHTTCLATSRRGA